MTSLSSASVSRTPVLADALFARRSLALDAALVTAGTLIVAVSAMISIPFYPVPFTLQTLAVLVVGTALGPKRAGIALTTYMVGGLLGIPWFADFTGGFASVFKPSFGYIIGFIPAAMLLGYCARRAWDRHYVTSLLAFGAGVIVPFLFGVPYLMLAFNVFLGKSMGLSAALAAGLYPFLIGEVIKWLVAAFLVPVAWVGVRRLEAHRDAKQG